MCEQLKDFLRIDQVWHHRHFRDDQMDYSRFAISKPHLASMDSERNIFFSAYKETKDIEVSMGLDFSFTCNELHHTHIAVVHCNGGSLPICDRYLMHDTRALFTHSFLVVLHP
jgi:hypothetical protein